MNFAKEINMANSKRQTFLFLVFIFAFAQLSFSNNFCKNVLVERSDISFYMQYEDKTYNSDYLALQSELSFSEREDIPSKPIEEEERSASAEIENTDEDNLETSKLFESDLTFTLTSLFLNKTTGFSTFFQSFVKKCPLYLLFHSWKFYLI